MQLKRSTFIHRFTIAALALIVLAGCGELSIKDPEAQSTIITIDELSRRLDAGETPFILDVRTVKEFNDGHIVGAVCIPHDQVAGRLDELPSDKSQEIIFHCRSGRRVAIAGEYIDQAGYTGVRVLEGHFNGWKAAGKPMVK